MRTLPETWSKNTYFYKINWRDDDICIAEQYLEEGGKLVAYEVFEVVKNQAGEIMGNPIEARESVPGSEKWGINAYTVWSLEKAYQKVNQLKRLINDRNARED